MISTKAEWSFKPFTTVPHFCAQSLEYEFRDPAGSALVSGFGANTRTFAFEYDRDLAPLSGEEKRGYKDYVVNIRARSGAVNEKRS